MRGLSLTTAATLVALACAVPVARADQQVVAGSVDVYTTPTVTMDQGERLTFLNQDVDEHSVTAVRNGPNGRPLFDTPLIGNGTTVFVAGSQYLTTGTYDFFCTNHSFMMGQLVVTANGTPVLRPIALSLTIPSVRLGTVARLSRLSVRAGVTRPARVTLTATVRNGTRTVTFARAVATMTRAGARSVALHLTATGRALAQHRSALTVTVAGSARDSTGKVARRTARRTLRR
jgi:plastocyanin